MAQKPDAPIVQLWNLHALCRGIAGNQAVKPRMVPDLPNGGKNILQGAWCLARVKNVLFYFLDCKGFKVFQWRVPNDRLNPVFEMLFRLPCRLFFPANFKSGEISIFKIPSKSDAFRFGLLFRSSFGFSPLSFPLSLFRNTCRRLFFPVPRGTFQPLKNKRRLCRCPVFAVLWVAFACPTDSFLNALAVFLVANGNIPIKFNTVFSGRVFIKSHSFKPCAYPFFPGHNTPLSKNPSVPLSTLSFAAMITSQFLKTNHV